MMQFIISLISLILYPIILPIRVMANPINGVFKKVVSVIFSITILLPLWIAGYVFIGFTFWVTLQIGGFIQMNIPVSGASMLPTFDEEGYVGFYRAQVVEQLKPEFRRGDVVVFQNDATSQEFRRQNKHRGGFVKRIVGLPGDTVLIKNGFVYVNGSMLDEPYILQPRSTFGGKAVRECSSLTVPDDKLLVLGDNRKVSMDSREIGFINYHDVEFYLPYEEQQRDLQDRWRDTSKDIDHAYESEFKIDEYVRLLNKKRGEHGLPVIQYNSLLTETAKRRAQTMLEHNDFSFEATRSGYTMSEAMREVGYWNGMYGEVPTTGYYTAQELIDSFFEYQSSREFFLTSEYQEIGVSTFVGNLDGCPVQVVVQHLAGYKAPDYGQSSIDGWRQARDRLSQVRGSWQQLKSAGSFYDENKADIDRINEIIDLRSSRIDQILSRMESNQWLTADEQRYVDEDSSLYDEQNVLAERINSKL